MKWLYAWRSQAALYLLRDEIQHVSHEHLCEELSVAHFAPKAKISGRLCKSYQGQCWTTSLNLYDVLPPVLKLYHFKLPFLVVSRYHPPDIGLTRPAPCQWSMLQSLLDMLSVFWYLELFRTKAPAPKLILYVFRTCLETASLDLLVLHLNALDALCHLCCCKFQYSDFNLRERPRQSKI